MTDSPSTPQVKREGSRVLATVTFDEPQTRAAEDQALKAFAQQIEIKGFRAGHAPAEMVRARVPKEDLFERTIRELLRTTLPHLLQSQNLHPIIQPKVEIVSQLPLTIRIIVVERPEVTVKGIDKLTVPKKPIAIDQKNMDRVVQSVLAEYRTSKPVERAAAKGDKVTIDFSAADEAKQPVSGMTAQGYTLTIGEAHLLPGFEDQLPGMKAGEEKTFALPIPPKHPAEHLRGKTVHFTVKMGTVEETALPELTDDFAKQNLQSASAAEFKNKVEESLKMQEEQFQRMERERELLELIRKQTQVELAPELLEEEMGSLIQEWQEQLQSQNQTVQQWMEREKKTEKDLDADFRKRAEERLKLRFGIQKIIEEKKITLSDEEMQAAVEQALQSVAPEQREEAKKMFAPGSEDAAVVRWRKTVEKAIDALLA